MTKSQTPTPAPAGVQHRYSTRKRKAALNALAAESESQSISQALTSSAHVAGYDSPPGLVSDPGVGAEARTMTDILGSINLLALSQDGTEMGRMLLVLSWAVESAEGAEDEREMSMGSDEGVEETLRAKMTFVKMVTEEVGMADKKRLRGLLKWALDVVGEFEAELDELDGRRG